MEAPSPGSRRVSTPDPSYLPDFANEEVRHLNDLVIQAEKALRNVEESVEEQDERTAIMEEHMKRLEQEILQTQCRSDAKRREIATEEHLKKLSEMEVARLKQDLVRIQKETEETVSSTRSISASIFKANEKIDKFRLLMQWNKEELEQWTKAAEQKDEDSFAVHMYTKTDDAKLKELYREAERASSELCTVQQVLDTEVTATQSAQIELDKTAEVFRTLHRERKELMQLWEDSVETIHKRDESIHKAAEGFAKIKSQLREEKHQLDDLAEKLAKEIYMINEIKKQIISKDQEAAKAQEYLQKESSSTKEAEEELVLMKRNLEQSTAQLITIKSQKFHVEEDLVNKRKKLEDVTKKLQETRCKVDDEFKLLNTLDKKRHELEKILVQEEANLKAAKKEVAVIKDKHYEASENLNFLCDKEKDTVYEIKGANAQSTALTNQIHQMEENVLKLDELVYSAEFQIQCLERKVARASGDKSDFETKELREKMAELEKELEEKKSEEVLVISQIKKAEEDGRAARRKREDLDQKVSYLEEKNSELALASETGLNAVKLMVKEKEEKMLARDLLQMEVNRLQEVLNLKADTVYGMEDSRERLKMSMETRKEEIESRFERQRKELKEVQQELHCLTLRKKRLYLHCEKLQAKYESLLKRARLEDGKNRSPQYYITKVAHERELMQQEGYRLEQQVVQVEHDIYALQAAMEDVKEANELLRHSHKSPKSKELEDEQLDLKHRLQQAFEGLYDKQNLQKSLLDEMARMQSRLQNLECESGTVKECVKSLEEQVEAACKEAEEQNQKLKRAQAQVNRLAKEIKSTYGDEMDRINKEMQLVELRETTKEALLKLKLLASDYPDYEKIIENKVLGAGFKIPSGTSSTRSSRSSASSVSSRGSNKSLPVRTLASPGSTRSSRSGSIVNLEFGGGSS